MVDGGQNICGTLRIVGTLSLYGKGHLNARDAFKVYEIADPFRTTTSTCAENVFAHNVVSIDPNQV